MHISERILNDNQVFLVFEIETSRFNSLNRREAAVIQNIVKETNFQKILEAKVDVNLKISKILSN